jgi:hypothetical protein
MKRKRIVILFGAGAAVDWNGPKTPDLTKLVRESAPQFICNDSNTSITEFIYRTLKESGYTESEVNFETIIAVIEELIIHFSLQNKANGTPSLSNAFFNSRFDEILLNFSIEKNKTGDWLKLQIPKGKEYEWQHLGARNGETPEQYFFQLLLVELLTNIGLVISKYSYHTSTFSKVKTEDNHTLNSLFQNWINKLNEDDAVLRMYTLNYDRLFKILALNAGIQGVFEGFDCGDSIRFSQNGIKAELTRIVSDFNCHCHYNLHGSAFWKMMTRDKKGFPNPEIVLHPIPTLQANELEIPIIQIERGKNTLVTNIISGYMKAQKSILPPFRQMHAAFDRDCLTADEMYIIGYSFSDEHINMSIKAAVKCSLKLKIHIVDPAFDERDGKKGRDKWLEVMMSQFSSLFEYQFDRKEISDVKVAYFNERITVHFLEFQQFLKPENS